MKKTIIFIILIGLFTSCTTQKRGYDYDKHKKRSAQFKKRAGCWHE